jgi:ferric-dicitrate binding protein FerR (iron transport regulator)
VTTGCPHTVSVELLEDGRLAQDDAKALGAHVVTCESCTIERARLTRLRTALRALPEPETSAFRVAAGKQRLLTTAAERERRVGIGGRRWLAVVAFGLTAAAAGAAFKLGGFELGSHAGHLAASTPANQSELDVRITPSPGADWSRLRTAANETVTLREGELTLAVVRHGAARFVVVLPDGELEDEGTVFRVRVDSGRTRVVSVSEGRVVLRLRAAAPRHLTAGETFEVADDEARAPATATAAAENAVPAPVGAQTHGDRDERGAHDEHAARIATAASGVKSSRDASPAREPECPGAPRFEDCVGTFKRGEYAAAAAQLAEYARLCGRHAEDASYLEMVALARAGRASEAKAQAKAYLARFPNGFRRKEAAELANAQ